MIMKKFILKYIVACMLFLCSSFHCYAIDGPITSSNKQLRHLFQYVVNPYPNVKFFYQLGAHVIDSAYYSTQCSLTTDCDTWFYAYKELGWCAYDTTWMESDNSIYLRARDVYSDTITFGIINYQYNTLKYSTLTTSDFFYFDIADTQLISKESYQPKAYNTGEIFMSSPLIATTQTNAPVYKIDPSFVFADLSFLNHMETQYDCFIDFDDGNGPQQIDLLHYNYHSVSYSSPGYHVLRTTIRLHSDTTVIIKQSNSGIVINSTPSISPQEYTDLSDLFSGLKVYQFDPECNMGNKDDKIIFILSGYNPGSVIKNNVRNVSTLYKNYIVDGNREILRQFGYTFVLVEWEDANRAIEQNAEYVMNLIEYYKCHTYGNEQFVLIGESMGALVGRYALTYMESDLYHNPNDCHYRMKHNVRLFISNDGPHLGANIPLSVQELVGSINTNSGAWSLVNDLCNAIMGSKLNEDMLTLNSTSVKQMLIYHYGTENDNVYDANSEHYHFLENLRKIGSYPKLCKNVALSNGSLLGFNQQQCYDSSNAGSFRLPNDNLLDLSLSFDFRVLWMTYSSDIHANLKTNPSGYGPLLRFTATSTRPRLSLYWWGIAFTQEIIQYANIAKDGKDLLPYCVSAGGAGWLTESGYFGNFPSVGFGLGGLSLTFPGMFSGIDYCSSPGYISGGFYIGIPWLVGVSAHANVSTDGAGFCLVPVQSAFCYNPNDWKLNRDYTSISTTTMFSNTFFDVLSGIPDLDESYRYNGIHTKYRNEVFRNQIMSDTLYQYNYVKNGVCGQVESRILNREVGDEELFLDNSIINGVASYSALIQIYVNYPHPYYNFDGQISTTYKIPGMFCRTDPFQIGSTGYALFQSQMGADWVGSFYGNYDVMKGVFYPCCTIKSFSNGSEEDSTTQANVSPNPIYVGEQLQIHSNSSITTIKLYDISGLFVAELAISENEEGITFTTIPAVVQGGLYYLNLYCEDEIVQTKLYIY